MANRKNARNFLKVCLYLFIAVMLVSAVTNYMFKESVLKKYKEYIFSMSMYLDRQNNNCAIFRQTIDRNNENNIMICVQVKGYDHTKDFNMLQGFLATVNIKDKSGKVVYKKRFNYDQNSLDFGYIKVKPKGDEYPIMRITKNHLPIGIYSICINIENGISNTEYGKVQLIGLYSPSLLPMMCSFLNIIFFLCGLVTVFILFYLRIRTQPGKGCY